MRGRQLFIMGRPILLSAKIMLRFLPTRFCLIMLRMARYCGGYFGLAIRYALVSYLAKACGDNVSIHDAVYVFHPEKLVVGNNVSIHSLCYVDAQGGIAIGNNVSIAHNVSLLSFEHDFSSNNMPIKDAPCIPKRIEIEDDVWVGAGVRVLGGCTIGRGTVVGANAVVTKSIPPLSIAVGVPAKIIGNRSAEN